MYIYLHIYISTSPTPPPNHPTPHSPTKEERQIYLKKLRILKLMLNSY